MSDKKLEDIEKRLNILEQTLNQKKVKSTKNRKPSEFNLFMAEQLKTLRKDLPMKEAWAKAIKIWNDKKTVSNAS